MCYNVLQISEGNCRHKIIIKLIINNNKMNKILICILLQIVLFIPFYLIWRNDCKTIGKDNLAVSLQERFLYWLIFCPIWLAGVLG